MTIQRLEHIGEPGLELQGETSVEGRWVDRIVGSRAYGWTLR